MKILKITLICCLIGVFLNAQTVHTVDNRDDAGAQFTSVQDAIDAASPNDIIQIHPSSVGYGNANVDITLTLVGLGHNPENTDGEVAKLNVVTFIGNSANSEIKGLDISAIQCGNVGNSLNLANMRIANNKIGSLAGSSVASLTSDNWIVEGNYFTNAVIPRIGSNNWQVKNNYFEQVARLSQANNSCLFTNNIMITSIVNQVFFSGCDDPVVTNNIFILTGNDTEVNIESSTISFNNNLTYNPNGLTIDALSGSNNLDNTNPQFVDVSFALNQIPDFYESDFNLQSTSPALGAGSNNADLGVYGLNFGFDVDGRPFMTPYPTSINITNTLVAPGQDLEVEFTATQNQ